MLGALIVVALLCFALLAAGVLDRRDHRRHVEHLLCAQDAERWAWQRERWDLITRLQSPDLTRYSPPPPPPPPTGPATHRPAEPLPVDLEPDESHMVGEVIARMAGSVEG